MAGPIATSAFNRLGQYASSPGTGPLLCRTRRFFPIGDPRPPPVLIVPTHGGMVRLSRSGWLWLNTQTVTHPSTNRARRRATTLIDTNLLPLSQAVTMYSESRVYQESHVNWLTKVHLEALVTQMNDVNVNIIIMSSSFRLVYWIGL